MSAKVHRVLLILANAYPSLTQSSDRPYARTAKSIDQAVEFGRDAWGTGQVVSNDVPALGANDAFVEFCVRFERARES